MSLRDGRSLEFKHLPKLVKRRSTPVQDYWLTLTFVGDRTKTVTSPGLAYGKISRAPLSQVQLLFGILDRKTAA
jgi:hypothetical protein